MADHQKKRLFLNLSLWLLVLVVGISVFTPVRDSILNHFFASAALPTPTIPAGDDLFYIQASPPGQVSIDGRLLTHMPNPTTDPPDAPLRLSPGTHHIVWESAPFQPMACNILVPSQPSTGLCKNETLMQSSTGQTVHLLTFMASFADLAVAQQQLLERDIQNVLHTLDATTPVLAGEQYLSTSPIGATSVVTTAQALQASVSYHLDTSLTSTRSCVDGYGDSCTYNGQNCLELCVFTDLKTVSGGGEVFTPVSGPDWYAIALVYATWTYRTPAGVLVAGNQSDYFDRYVGIDHSLILHFLWKNGTWSISIVPTNAVNFVVVDPACATLNGLVSAEATYDRTQGSPSQNLSWSVAVGANRADGCLGVATTQQGVGSAGYFLYRFGVLLAANAVAHRYLPSLPVADSYEQTVAQQLASQSGL
jgi:hypothetical protein